MEQPLKTIQQHVWDARLPLQVRLAPAECRVFDKADPYLVCPRSLHSDLKSFVLLRRVFD